MSAVPFGAVIGPNAVIQLGEALRPHRGLAEAVFAAAGHGDWLSDAPEQMVPEGEVAALHAALYALSPRAAALAEEAGTRTGDYILANRIPAAARLLLRALPAALAEPLLVAAIARHAWTFAGSGRFVQLAGRPAQFGIDRNPLARDHGRCRWHEAVFTRLWQRLIDPAATVVETCCGHGTGQCRFAVRRASG